MNHLTNTFDVIISFRLIESILILVSIINLSVINTVDLLKKLKLFLLKKIKNSVILQIFKIWTFWLLNFYTILDRKKLNIHEFNGFILKNYVKKKRPLNYLVQLKLIKKILISKSKHIIHYKISNIINQPFVKNNNSIIALKKKLIRKSIFFSKTKYSFIRQECKNIVNMTLLINIIYIILVFSVYMKFKFIFGAVYLIIIVFILLNYTLLFKLKKIVKTFLINIQKLV